MSRSVTSQLDTEVVPRVFGGSMAPALKASKRQIRRNRTAYSCVTCRRRKVKCDKVHPTCGGCRKANEQCTYGLDDVPSATVDEESNSEAKKRKISAPSQTPSTTSSASASSSSEAVPPAHLKAIEDQLSRLNIMLSSLRRNGGSDQEGQDLLPPMTSRAENSSHQQRGLDLDMSQQTGAGPTRYTNELTKPFSGLKLTPVTRDLNDPFWSNISEELDQLNQWMRGRSSDYSNPTGVQEKLLHDNCMHIPNGHSTEEVEDFWNPTSFRKEAGHDVPENYDPVSSCPVCQAMPFAKSTLLQGMPIRCSPATAKHLLLKNLPTRTQSNVLLRCWLSGVYPIMPIWDPAELVDKHETFWDHLETYRTSSDSSAPDLDFFPLIYAIWYTASLGISGQGLQHWFSETSRAKLASGFHDQVVICLHLGSFTRNPSLQKLAALILCISLPVAEEDPIQASLYMQLVVRLACTMGLHREPSLFNVSKSEEGSCRRLWWQVVQMDVSLVAATGFASQISEAFCDTKIVYEGRDSALQADEAQGDDSDESRAVSSSNDTPKGQIQDSPHQTLTLIGRARSIMACALRRVVAIHLGTKVLTNVDVQEMKQIMHDSGEQVDAIIKKIPAKGLPELGFVPDRATVNQQRALDCDQLMAKSVRPNETTYDKSYTSEEEIPPPLARYYRQKMAAYNKWARISLSMLKDKIACIAYVPFLKNAKSKLWRVGRQCALHNSHSFLRKFVSLASDPDLEPFRWTWPAMFGPVHAVMIALVDLHERPDSPEAPRARELVDSILSLSAPEFGIVGGPNGVTVQRPMRESGPEAWDLLRGLRSAAWQKAGLDPAVLWTVDDQRAVGLAVPLTEDQKQAQSLREDTLYDQVACDTNVQLARDIKTEPQTTERRARYLVKLALVDFDGSERDEHPCTRVQHDRFLKRIENDSRSNRNWGLARLAGQQAMPFPVGGRMEQCSSGVGANGLPQEALLQINGHLPRARFYAQSRPVPLHGDKPTQQGETIPTGPFGDQALQGNLPVSGSSGPSEIQQNTQLTETPTDVSDAGNDLRNGYSSDPHHQQIHDLQSHQDGPNPGLHHDGPSVADGELGFDWERWDAVFGQYSGFTDLMEDVTWADHVDE